MQVRYYFSLAQLVSSSLSNCRNTRPSGGGQQGERQHLERCACGPRSWVSTEQKSSFSLPYVTIKLMNSQLYPCSGKSLSDISFEIMKGRKARGERGERKGERERKGRG